ncbi:hypothetical protein G7054_g9333 [Neopestalotiopsis clavispora]|nr:hypothetical protein G7054_g9333 [Neopestalotiopsis clavispora]
MSDGTIRARAAACQQLFTQCLSLTHSDHMAWFEMRRGEFNIWAYGLQALSSGKSSLDYRVLLRHDVKGIILALLGGLAEDLEDCIKIGKGLPQKEEEIEFLRLKVLTCRADEKLSSEATSDVGPSKLDEQSDQDFDFIDFSDDEAKSESETSNSEEGLLSLQMYNIKTIIAQLARFSSMIRRSGTKFRFQRADSALALREPEFADFKEHMTNMILIRSIKFDVRDLTGFDVFQDKMSPGILTPVQKRFIHGNILRRNRIMEATRNMRSAKPQGKDGLKDPMHDRKFVVPEIKALEPMPTPHSKAAQSNAGGTVRSSAQSKVESIARTATEIGPQLGLQLAPPKAAPSVMTKVTKIASNQEYPKCPKPISDNFIQCPYCADMLPAEYKNSSSRWRGHVAQDILPYMCIYEQCPSADEMYLTSEELISHVQEHHARTMWACDLCLPKASEIDSYVFESPIEWQQHMQQSHDGSVLVQQLPSLARFSEREVIQAVSCPLCAYTPTGIQTTIDQHILQHLHEFALRSLPSRADHGTDGSISDNTVGRSSTYTDSADRDEEAPPVMTRASLQQDLNNCIEIMSLGLLWTTTNPDKMTNINWVQELMEPIRVRAAIFLKNYDRLSEKFPERIDRLRMMAREATSYCPTKSTPGIETMDIFWILRDWVRPFEVQLEILNDLPEEKPTENPMENKLPNQPNFDLSLPQNLLDHIQQKRHGRLEEIEDSAIGRSKTLQGSLQNYTTASTKLEDFVSRKQNGFLALLDGGPNDFTSSVISHLTLTSPELSSSKVHLFYVDLNDVQFGAVKRIGDLDRVFEQIATVLLEVSDLMDIRANATPGSDLVEVILAVANGMAKKRWLVIIDNLTVPIGYFLRHDTTPGEHMRLPKVPVEGSIIIASPEQPQLPKKLEKWRIDIYPGDEQTPTIQDDQNDVASSAAPLTAEILGELEDGANGISTQSTRASRGGSRTRQPKTTRLSGSNSNDEDDTIKARSGVEVGYDGIKIRYDKGGQVTLERSGGGSDRSDVPGDGPGSLFVS